MEEILMHTTRAKFITILGINNTGKTTQRELLATRLQKIGVAVCQTKYPQYDLPPTGPMINAYLREGNPRNFTPREFQILQAMNRTHFQPELTALLDDGVWVIAEDYAGTGIAWGVGAGVDEAYLREINAHLRKEDLTILLDGKRFASGIERGNAHETGYGLIGRVREIHLDLARAFDWAVLRADRPREEVHEEIWGLVRSRFLLG